MSKIKGPSDAAILKKANEIVEKGGGSLIDAMIQAEHQLTPKPDLQTEFTVSFTVKPRIARWILEEFVATDEYTTEERVGAYLAGVMARARTEAIRNGRAALTISTDGATTVTAAQLAEQAR